MQDSPGSLGSSAEFHAPAVCAAVRIRDERLAALKAFAGRLAHDFRNSLVPQLGYATLVKEQTAEDSPALPFVAKLESSTRRLENYLDAILLAVRPERRFAPKPCDFAALVRRVLKAWKESLPEEASIRITVDMDPCELVADESQWAVAIEHLLKNARFSLATGGSLRIGLRARSLTPEQAAEIGLAATPSFQLVVQDDGFGMAESVLQRACEPFFTTRPKGQAAGLGLTLVHSVARLHGGQVVLESAEDAGTTVTLWLPASAPVPDLKRSALQPAPGSAATAANAKVLLVEPDPLVLEATKSYLKRLPVEIVSTEDVKQGLKLFQRGRSEWRAVVAGAGLPGVSALDLCAQIRRWVPGISVILIRGDTGTGAEGALAELGSPPAAVLKKPFALKTLADTLSALVR